MVDAIDAVSKAAPKILQQLRDAEALRSKKTPTRFVDKNGKVRWGDPTLDLEGVKPGRFVEVSNV